MSSLRFGPGSAKLAGAGLFLPLAQGGTVPPIHPADSVVDRKLLGDTITPIIQWIFQQSPWVMWGGVVLAAIIAFFLVRWAWPKRTAIVTWLRTRSRSVKFALVGTAAFAALVAAGLGFKSYEFVETDKRFCNGCHIFVPSGQVWVKPDSGTYTLVPLLEGKHDSINCHTCHPLKPMKEAVKLVFWMSGVRGKEIPEHAKVPRAICEDCHVRGSAKETWQAIAATAGHRTHLESDSSALKGKVECLTCHAQTAHRFPPANQTCGQSGCHNERETEIVLGKMASAPMEFHCTGCHDFVATVPALATRDSAASSLRPAIQQCFRCHEMKARLPDFDAAKDPHNGACGMCHNPHTQKAPSDAKTTCTDAKCHADWRSEPFHTGAPHRGKAQQCTLCHQPHAARVDGSNCTACHTDLRTRVPGGGPPLPFDTLKALRSLAPEPTAAPPERPSKVKGDAPPGQEPPERPPRSLSAFPSDTFSHPTHKKLPCLTCHATTTGQKLTFEAPRGCQICHHQAAQRNDCAQCHTPGSLRDSNAVSVTIASAGRPARQRPVRFGHETHRELRCTSCHGQPVSLAVVDSALSCRGCHTEHHEKDRDCASCHRTTTIREDHPDAQRTHEACDACHTPARIAALQPGRKFCLACHEPSDDHDPARECTDCHFQATPEQYRPRLSRGGGGP